MSARDASEPPRVSPQRMCCAPQAAAEIAPMPKRARLVASGAPPRHSLIAIPRNTFLMGSDAMQGYRADGEGPQRRVTVGGFSIARCAVSNAEFQSFVTATGYVTDAERAGWSFVFHQHVCEQATSRIKGRSCEAAWWLAVEGACWHRPEGAGSNLTQRADHPVTHISWHDASAYCQWSGTRLPTEAEWECAARGGLEGRTFPWGDALEPHGRHCCNIWQGTFPSEDTGDDGFTGTAPVRTFAPNGYGLFNVAGNVWEWCADWFSPNYHRVTRLEDPRYVVPSGRRAMRGGSFLCHHSYCHRYRVAARGSNTPDSSASHCGFRIAM